MRQGQVFKRCTKCHARVGGRRWPKCGSVSATWYFVVDVTEKDDKGRLIGRRIQKKQGGFATKADATAAMNQLQVQKADGTYVEPSRLTVAEYLERWLAGGCGGHVPPSTPLSYQGAVRPHIVPRIGRPPLPRTDTGAVKALYQELRTSGYTPRTKPEDQAPPAPRALSSKTVHNVHLALRKALGDAVEEGLIRTNPAASAHRLDRDSAPEMLTWSR